MRILLAVLCLFLIAGCGDEDNPSAPTVSQDSPFAGQWTITLMGMVGEYYGVLRDVTISPSGYGVADGVIWGSGDAEGDTVMVGLEFTVDSYSGAVTGETFNGSQVVGTMYGYFSNIGGSGRFIIPIPSGGAWYASRYYPH